MSDVQNQETQETQETQQTQETHDDPNVLYKADGTPVKLNDLMAKHKRGVQGELKQTRQEANEAKAANARLKSLAESLAGGEVEDTETFMRELAETINTLDSDADRAAKKAKKDAKELADAKEAATTYRALYEDNLIERAIKDAAPIGSKAYTEGTQELIVDKLKQRAIVKDGKAIFDGGKDEEGEQVVWDAKQAVDDMEGNEKFHSLFTATVKAGTSGEVVDGMKFTKEGGVDPADMKDFAKYRELKRKNPEALEKTFGKATGQFTTRV